jgi:hypothetical protein
MTMIVMLLLLQVAIAWRLIKTLLNDNRKEYTASFPTLLLAKKKDNKKRFYMR